ncbi:hypothetical protein WDU94_015620, partial [Cyamophila willieti]
MYLGRGRSRQVLSYTLSARPCHFVGDLQALTHCLLDLPRAIEPPDSIDVPLVRFLLVSGRRLDVFPGGAELPVATLDNPLTAISCASTILIDRSRVVDLGLIIGILQF